MKSYEDAEISINDILHTLSKFDRNKYYEQSFEYMLTFASELTGISETLLRSSMYEFSVEPRTDSKAIITTDGMIADIKKQLLRKENCSSYGEPQAWGELKNGRSIEVTLEQEGLEEKDYFYSVRLHCSNKEYENHDYHCTNGVIDQYSSSGSSIDELDGLIKTAVACNERYPISKHSLSEDIHYPIDLGNGYKIQTVFANQTSSGTPGEVYDYASDVIHSHPSAEILTGYCVIDESTGILAKGCNTWNHTLSAAVRDYEAHVLGYDEDIELNYTELDEHGNTVRAILFSVNSFWLQNYLGVDNQCQLEALLTNSDEWDPADIFIDAQNENTVSGLQIGEITEYSSSLSKSNSNIAVHLGRSIFVDWANLDLILNQWAKSYFGNHTSAQGSRDDTDFEVELKHLRPHDFSKFSLLFDTYDKEHDYDSDTEFETTCILPVSISLGIMQEVLPEQTLIAYGTAVATYSGVFFMECNQNREIAPEKLPSRPHATLSEQIKVASSRSENTKVFSDVAVENIER